MANINLQVKVSFLCGYLPLLAMLAMVVLEKIKSKQKTNNSHKKDKHRYGIEQWVKGEINGGGPEYTFSSINGDVIIREKE